MPNQLLGVLVHTIACSGIDPGSGLLASSLEYAVADEYKIVQPAGHFIVDANGNYRFTLLRTH
jgi:hypothetical protein